jgi:glycosyl transferase family 2
MKTFLLTYSPYVLPILLISLVDFIVLIRSRFAKKHAVEHHLNENHDFTILVPIFGNISYLKNIDFLKQYGPHVVLCTTTRESPRFYQEITRIAQEGGFRIFQSSVPLSSRTTKPNPWKLFTNTLHGSGKHSKPERESAVVELNREIARDEIMRDSFAAITTRFCIFLDADTVAREKIPALVHLFETKGLDIASVRVLASKCDTLMEKLQSVEYELAMDARRVYPWLTSGACMVAKTEVIKDIMSHHSLFFSGGDIEIGKLARMLKYAVGHLSFSFYTDVPSTFRAWFRQRMAWFGGGFRHAVVNIHRYSWRHPLFYFYTTFLVYLATPLRLYEAVRHPEVILVIIGLYWALIYTFHWRHWRWFYIFFPFYALIQVMVIVPLGMYTYVKMAIHGRNIGFIKLRSAMPRPALSTHSMFTGNAKHRALLQGR